MDVMFRSWLVLILAAAAPARGGPAPILEPMAAQCYTALRPVHDVLPAQDGGFWAATEGGLVQWQSNGTVARIWTRADGLPGHTLLALAAGPEGEPWVASAQGVARVQNGRVDAFTTAEGLNDDLATAVLWDPAAGLLAGTARGVCGFVNGRFQPIAESHEFARRSVHDLHAAADGSVWVAYENGLSHHRPDGSHETFRRDLLQFPLTGTLPCNETLCVVTDERGRPWVGTRQGLAHDDGTGWRVRYAADPRIPTGSGLRANHVATLAMDAAGWLWIGYGRGGPRVVTLHRGAAWRDLPVSGGDALGQVLRIRRGPGNAMWLAMEGGVARCAGARLAAWSNPAGLPDNQVRALVPLADGGVAVLTATGATCLAPAGLCNGNKSTMLASVMRAMAENNAQASTGGPPPGAPSLRGFQPTVTVPDPAGGWWVGTRRHGLWRWRAGAWQEVRLRGRALPAAITALALDAPGVVWVGTANEGVLRLVFREPAP